MKNTLLSSPSEVRTRIAPSPTGIAHVGTAYIALFNYAFAKQNGGSFFVRIEDTDRGRFVEGAEQVIYDALQWLGIKPDESPLLGGQYAPYRQSERLAIYKEHVQQLIQQGKAYYCFATAAELDEMRKAQQKRGELPRYDGRFREYPLEQALERVKAGEPHVVRMKMPTTGQTRWHDLIRGDVVFENSLIDDQVLLKSDGYPTYHLAVVIDDHLMNTTHVLRGEEWISSTPKHLVLYDMFGWQPPVYAHMPLLRNPDHSKLSKRKNDVSLVSYMQKGYLPEALINYLCLLGWSHPEGKEVFDLAEFVRVFTMDRMQKTGPVFDFTKLNWLNGLYIREKLTTEESIQRLQPFLPANYPKDRLPEFLPLIRERLMLLSEVEMLTNFFYVEPVVSVELLLGKKGTKELVAEQLQAVLDALSGEMAWDHARLEQVIRELQEARGWVKGQFFMMLRVAVTGKTTTPPLFETMQVVGKELCVQRLLTAQNLVR